MGYITAETDKDFVKVWERRNGVRHTKLYRAPAELYIEDPRGTHTSYMGKPLRKITYKNLRDLKTAREQFKDERVQMYESDISPAIKILSEHYYKDEGEKLHVTYLDIENDYDLNIGHATMENPYAPINAIAMYHEWCDRSVVLAVPPPGWDPSTFDETLKDLSEIRLFDTEEQLLLALLDEIEDSDMLIGWNSNIFDFPYIGKRLAKVVPGEFRRMSFKDGR